jgi:hypothetical protein
MMSWFFNFNKFINEWRGWQSFCNSSKLSSPHLVVYSEGSHDWPHMWPMLKEFIRILKAVSIISTDKNPSQCPMIFTSKKFYPRFDGEKFEDTVENNIFIASERLLGFIGNGQFEYIIDGLIYTPTLLGVGSSRISEAGPKKKKRKFPRHERLVFCLEQLCLWLS